MKGQVRLTELMASLLAICLCLILLPSQAAFAQGVSVCPIDMISYWNLDETAQPFDDMFDVADATCSSCPSSVTGVAVNALSFDGSSEVDVPADPAYDWGAGSSFSIEFWMKTDYDCPGDDNQHNAILTGRYDGAGGSNLNLWWIGVNCATSGSQYPQGVIRFVLKDDSGGPIVYGSTDVTDGDWHHVVAIRDADNDQVIIFVDGNQDGVMPYGPFTDGFASSADLNIGYLNFSTLYHYDGDIDEIALYDRALVDTEIQDHYDRGKTDGKGYCKETPWITSAPVNSGFVGEAYTYDVDATGDPQPTYSLVDAPEFMTIDDVTGLIEWSPSAIGDYNVTVEATNEVGSHQQPFTISVVEIPPCPDGMSHYWKLDEESGEVYEDFYGTNDAVSLPGDAPTPATGLVGYCQEFDGIDDEISIADDNSFDWGPDDNFTIEFWMKKGVPCEGSSSTSYNEVIFGRYGLGASDLNIMWIGINCNASDGTSGGVRFVLRDDASGGTMIITEDDYTDGAWHHIVAIRDADVDSILLYIDGEYELADYFDYTLGFDDTTHVGIGYIPFGEFFRYEGSLDELAIYDRRLAPSEIETHYQNGLLGLAYCDEVVPAIVSTPITGVTVGQVYQYDVDATGNPDPTYALITYPATMTVDPASGLIEWTPTMPGSESVSVEAFNDAGADTQSFTIDVIGLPPCPEGMQHYWLLEESSGPDYHDLMGAADASGPLGTCPDWCCGMVNGAQAFVRGEADGLDVTDASSFDWSIDASFSIEFWILKNSDCGGTTNSENNIVVGRYDGKPGDGELNIWWVGVNCYTAEGVQGAIRLVLREDITTGLCMVGETVVTDGKWHHVVVTRDGTTGEHNLYVDGALDATMPYTFMSGFSDNSPVNIGYIDFGSEFHFDGSLDELTVYDEVLALEDVTAHYYSGFNSLGYCCLCGDADYSGGVDIDDVVYLIGYIFSGGPQPVVAEAGDADCSGDTDIDDVVYLIGYIFSGGPLPCELCPTE